MATTKKRPVRDPELLADIHERSMRLVQRELKRYEDDGSKVPPALLTAAATILKMSDVKRDLSDSRSEAQEFTFVSRISVEDLPDLDEQRIEEERIIEENKKKLGIKPAVWTADEIRAIEQQSQ